jgi:two-component system, response regulator, stage 0 sporulation protein F
MKEVGKILVVDDQFGVRRLLFETFQDDKHEVAMAEDGAEALQLLIDFKPDLILMDMKMPRMNGMETLEQIRALDCQVSVIMMTAYGDSQNMEQAKDLGILFYMAKPFDLFELRARVREILPVSK